MANTDELERELAEIRRLRAEGKITAQEAYTRHLDLNTRILNAPPEAPSAPVAVAAPPAALPPGLHRNEEQPPGAEPDPLGRLVFNRDERLSRLLLFTKFLFCIPLFLWLGIYRAAALVCAFLAFWAILITGRYPPGLFGFVRGYISSHYRVYSYFPLLLSDEWTAGNEHPLRFEIEPPAQQSRLLLIFAKLPAMVLGVFYGIASVGTGFLMLLAIPMWFVILVIGKYPTGIRGFALGVLQWSARVTAWQFMMSDDWRMFGSSLKVRIPTVVAAYAVPAVMMWLTFWGPSFEFGDLFGVDDGMKAVDAFMVAGRESDVLTAKSLVDTRQVSDADLNGLLRRRELFDGYEKATMTNWYRQAGTDGDQLQLEGELRYAGGDKGNFAAFLRKSGGTWLIEGIIIHRNPP